MFIDTISTVMTAAFLLIILSYYLLLFIPNNKKGPRTVFHSISIIIPARNEEKYIGACIQSVLDAEFKGRKEILVVDDKSKDGTSRIVKEFMKEHPEVKLIRNSGHSGKSYSINKALQVSDSDLIAIVDGDSLIAPNALVELSREVGRKGVAGATGVIKVENRKSFLNPWVHLELIYGSMIRSIQSKVHANVVTPGALSMYRRKELMSIGGFSTEGFSEDADIGVRLLRAGHKIGFCDTAYSSTNMPDTPKNFWRQRIRNARGMVFLLKKHLQLNSTIIDLYTLPLFLFTYIQSIIMGSITIYKIISGYFIYFADKGQYFNWYVVRFIVEWLSIFGFLHWTFNVFTGAEPWTLLTAIGIASTLLSYPLFIYAIIKYDKKLDLWHIVPFTVMFPFWLILMIIAIVAMPEALRTTQYNRWKKNE